MMSAIWAALCRAMCDRDCQTRIGEVCWEAEGYTEEQTTKNELCRQ